MITSKKVEIGRVVHYSDLEKALRKAAEKVGWTAEVRDIYKQGYRLGSVQETEEYDHTEVTLRGRVFPIAQVNIYGKGDLTYFFVSRAGRSGRASKRIQQYLSAVSKHLPS